MLNVKESINPCQECGACCSFFRVSFHWIETSDANENPVPSTLVQSLGENMVCMNGTNQNNPKCTSLVGEVGVKVACGIYKNRSSSCKELQSGEDKCNQARLSFGLPAL